MVLERTSRNAQTWLVAAILAIVSAGCPRVLAATPRSGAADGCSSKATAAHTVARIVDARSIVVDGNQEIVLAGLLVPSAADAGTRPSGPWPSEIAAQDALSAIVAGRSVALAYPSTYFDRYGRRPAHVFVRNGQHVVWLQAELVRLGFARVDVASLTAECANPLLVHERAARRSGIGLWAHAAYQPRSAAEPRTLLRYQGTYQIVEGRIARAARVRNRIYLNFSRDWRRDFSVGISLRTWRLIEAKGQKLEQFSGRRVRIRGWIERRGGPFIYLRSPLELEMLPAQNPGQTSSSDGHRRAPAPTSSRDRERNRSSSPMPNEKRPAASPPGALEL